MTGWPASNYRAEIASTDPTNESDYGRSKSSFREPGRVLVGLKRDQRKVVVGLEMLYK